MNASHWLGLFSVGSDVVSKLCLFPTEGRSTERLEVPSPRTTPRGVKTFDETIGGSTADGRARSAAMATRPDWSCRSSGETCDAVTPASGVESSGRKRYLDGSSPRFKSHREIHDMSMEPGSPRPRRLTRTRRLASPAAGGSSSSSLAIRRMLHQRSPASLQGERKPWVLSMSTSCSSSSISSSPQKASPRSADSLSHRDAKKDTGGWKSRKPQSSPLDGPSRSPSTTFGDLLRAYASYSSFLGSPGPSPTNVPLSSQKRTRHRAFVELSELCHNALKKREFSDSTVSASSSSTTSLFRRLQRVDGFENSTDGRMESLAALLNQLGGLSVCDLSSLASPLESSTRFSPPSPASVHSNATWNSSEELQLLHLPDDMLTTIGFYLDGQDLARFGATCRRTYATYDTHPAWKHLVLKTFGFKYENFMIYTHREDWRLLYGRVASFLVNLSRGSPEVSFFPRLLEPVPPFLSGVGEHLAESAQGEGPLEAQDSILHLHDHRDVIVEEDEEGEGVDDAGGEEVEEEEEEMDVVEGEVEEEEEAAYSYEGILAVTADSKILLWENGSILQAISLEYTRKKKPNGGCRLTGEEMWRIPLPGPRTRASRPCLVNSRSKVFVHLNGEISVFDLYTGNFIQHLVNPEGGPWRSVDFALDITIRNDQLGFLTTNALYLWDTETLEYLHKVEPPTDVVASTTDLGGVGGGGSLDFLWCGYQCTNGFNGLPCTACATAGSDELLEPSGVGCVRRSLHIVAWLRRRSPLLWIHAVEDGRRLKTLKGHDAPVLRVRQAVNLKAARHYFLASMDEAGVVKVWDSSRNFPCVSTINTYDRNAFRLHFTPNRIFTLTDQAAEARGDASFGGVMLRVWQFNADRIGKEKKSSRTTTNAGVEEESIVQPLMAARLPSNVYFCDIIDNHFLGVWFSTRRYGSDQWSEARSNWQVFESGVVGWLADTTPSSAAVVLSHCASSSTTTTSNPFHSLVYPPGSPLRSSANNGGVLGQREEERERDLEAEEEESGRRSEGGGGGGGEDELRVMPTSELLSRQAFHMTNRVDAWTLLDWKSFSILPNGSLLVHDFCPET